MYNPHSRFYHQSGGRELHYIVYALTFSPEKEEQDSTIAVFARALARPEAKAES
jgi:hypothetical protein